MLTLFKIKAKSFIVDLITVKSLQLYNIISTLDDF